MAASPVGAVTIDQLLRNPAFVAGVRSRIGATGMVFTKFYGLGIDGAVGLPPIPPGIDLIAWDYFDNTRTMAESRPALSGPSRIIPKAAGAASGVLLRFYEALLFEDNKIAGFRPMGKPIGTISPRGEDFVARQVKYMLQRQANSQEFAASRLFRGGFDVKNAPGGDRQTLVEKGSGQISVDYKIPATHLTKLALLAGGADIIDASWATASTDVILQYHNLRQAAERESGLPVHHGWISSVPYVHLINNDKLRAAGGSAFRVWEQLQTNRMETMAGFRERGDEVVFRALPQITFHVYDGVLNVDQDRDSFDIADNSLFIPNDKCIFTPDPGDWCGIAVGQEIVTEQYGGRPQVVEASHNWARRIIEPTSGTDLHNWSKYLPILFIPKATYYATVVF